MPTRDVIRYMVAIVVGVFMWLSGDSPWTTIGIVVIVAAVLAAAWHRSLLAGRE